MADKRTLVSNLRFWDDINRLFSDSADVRGLN